MDTREPMRFKADFIIVKNKTWKNLTEEDNISPLCSTEMLDPKSNI